MQPDLSSFDDTSKRLKISKPTLRRLADKGALRTITIGARRLIPELEIQRVIREGVGTPRPRRARNTKVAAAR